jgi:hypothetical protein
VLSIGIRVILFIKGLITRRVDPKGKAEVPEEKDKEILSGDTPVGGLLPPKVLKNVTSHMFSVMKVLSYNKVKVFSYNKVKM